MASLAKLGSDIRITEVDLSSTIQQNSSIVAAIAGVSSKGPIGPTYYTTFAQFRNDWGDPKASVSFDHYAVADYFREGSGLWAYRVVASDATTGALIMYVTSGGVTTLAPITLSNVEDIDWLGLVPSGATPLYVFYSAKGPGSYSANFSMAVTSVSLTTPTNVITDLAATGGTLFAGTYAYRVSAIDRAGNETLASASVSRTVATGITNAITVSWDAVAGAVGYRVYGRTSGSMYLLATVGPASGTHYVDTGVASVDASVAPLANAAALVSSPQLTLSVYDSEQSVNSPVESFDVSLIEEVDDMGIQMETALRVNPFSEYLRCVSYVSALATLPRLSSVAKTALGKGTSGTAPTSSDIVNGWNVFADREKYVLDVLINSGRAVPSVQKAMDTLAQSRNDCVAFLDTPSVSQKAQAAIDYRRLNLNLNSSFSALFCPDLYELDPINGKQLYVPPSGSMAALLSRTTRVAQPWFSMAGLNRGLLNVLGVRYTYTPGEATSLYQAQVNYMRQFIGRGIPLWEQSTLYNKPSALQFLNVRVLANVIKRSVYDYLLYALQEPNDEILRKQLTYGLEEYLNYVQGARGIRSYAITCNDSNNPPAVVNAGQLNIAVYIVPTLGTRAISMSLLIGKTGLQVSEQDVAALTT